jgi:capsular polysaccharide biosynthesis protein
MSTAPPPAGGDGSTPLLLRERLSMGILALGLVAGGAGGALVAAQQPTVYRATATVFVETPPTTVHLEVIPVGEEVPSPGVAGAREVRSSYAEIVTTPFVLNSVIDELHLRTTAAALARRVHVDEPSNPALLHIAVDDARPARAATIADAIAAQEVSRVSQLTPAGEHAPVRLSVLGPSGRTVRLVAPDVPLDLGIGALTGLLGAAAVVLLRQRNAVRRAVRRWATPAGREDGAVGHAPSMFD